MLGYIDALAQHAGVVEGGGARRKLGSDEGTERRGDPGIRGLELGRKLKW
jgi:hypothetical protein